MENEKSRALKGIYIWLFQAVIFIAVLVLFFLNLISLFAAILFVLVAAANSLILLLLFSDLKKDRETCNTESQQKTKEIEEFDKITRQLVKRDIELARANQRLGELDEAKSDFISVAAHQLRTPLTGIKWSYSALLDSETGPLNDTQKDIAEKGLASISHTIELINDLLNAARLEEGKLTFEFKKQSLVPVAQKALAHLKLTADEKKITVSAKIPAKSELPEMNIDAEKMELALTNILDNAVKYTPSGGRIDFSVEQLQGMIQLTLQDTGIGIPKNQRSRLFTKFFRAANAVSVQTSGTGLGLYMVKKIIDRHNGKIMVDSAPGKGTTFIITIPEATAKKS